METENGQNNIKETENVTNNNVMETEKVTFEVNDFKRSSPLPNDDDDDITLPGKLVRKRSKQ